MQQQVQMLLAEPNLPRCTKALGARVAKLVQRGKAESLTPQTKNHVQIQVLLP